ncbi:hypothetical protein KC333_g4945 [Hortaea werneckii]|nr:hypothetical protein KC333_g4945 [Hortaea werneckii]KAI7312275.1 hypothetical protein KC326_g5944 [Hortaea werneckii]
MSLYSPDDGAIPRDTDFVRTLSQRDLGLRIPVNYVSYPGVCITPACFAHQRYEDGAAAKCFSNLLAIGFRRMDIDLYWDASRSVWSLCPVQLGDSGGPSNKSYNTSTSSSLPPGQLSTVSLGTAADLATTSSPMGRKRQDLLTSMATQSPSIAVTRAPNTPVELPSITTTATLSAGDVTTAIATGTSMGDGNGPSSEGTLIGAGPYACTTSVNFDLFMSIMAAFLADTETDLNATTLYLSLNLHAAAPADDPTASADTPAANALPSGRNLLSSIIQRNNSAYTYTPGQLREQRSNLDARGSWFEAETEYRPESVYFTVNDADQIPSTPNGWPSESFIELSNAQRLLVEYGSVDPQMEGYNFTADASQIFPQDYISSSNSVDLNASGVAEGCFFQEGSYEVSIANNNSWALHHLNDGELDVLSDAGNLTDCGISPILNQTLEEVTASENYRPYLAYVASTMWPWGAGEPRRVSEDDSDDNYRCASLNATTGRWQATDCQEAHYGACRENNEPYRWRISTAQGIYQKVDRGCNSDSEFATPRTALENTYLVNAWREYLQEHPNPNSNTNTQNNGASQSNDELLWLNFNNLDATTCWVLGQNTTCPYISTMVSETRQVVVPTVAAVIVFVCAVLTIFVKCAANRQNTKRRKRRGEDGWDYEGVPS